MATSAQAPWGGFTTENIWDYNYGQDLNPLSQQTGVERDDLATQRDAFLQPWEQRYRSANGGADATSANLTNSQEFRSFVQNATPAQQQNATPAQQWNAQPTAQPAVPQGMQPSQAYNVGPTSTTGDALIQQLMARAQQPTNASRTDPNVRGQADAYAANVDRSRRGYISDVAERRGPLANIEGERRMASERAGQATGAFEAELMGRETSARRDEIAQALQMWGGLLSGDQRMGLERELATLNDRSRTADRGQNMEQFLRELALREYDTTNRWDYNWLLG
jgi:hypothetical protein